MYGGALVPAAVMAMDEGHVGGHVSIVLRAWRGKVLKQGPLQGLTQPSHARGKGRRRLRNGH